MVAQRLLCGLLLLLSIPAEDGTPVFQPSFIYMSGTSVTASLTNSSANGFSISVADGETGLFPSADCSGRNRMGDWILNVTYQENVSIVTVRLTKNLQLCTSNVTDCCTDELCLVEAVQVLACRDSVVVASLLIQAEIYVNTSLGNFTGKGEDNATVIPNQVFQPMGPCPCNLTAGACDIRCCCDSECTPEMKELFNASCFTGVFGGEVNPPFDQLCSTDRGHSTPDWFPFLCVESSLSNTPFLGYFYHGAVSSSQASPLRIPLQTVPGKLSSGYRQGDPILIRQNVYFMVPQPFFGGHCARNAPVAFLQDFEASCLTPCQAAESMLASTAVNSGFGDNIKIQVNYETKNSDISGCAGRECRNVSFSEEYTIIWEGMKIVEMKVTVISGAICPEETLVQKFTVNFVSVNATSTEELSGNPGYQLGKPIRATNLNSSEDIGTLKLWKPDGKGSCTSASLTSLLFGVNVMSGCILEVDLNDSCSQLRENVVQRLNTLVEATYVGKRGNSNASIPDDWVEIICLEAPGPSTNGSSGDLKGICLDIPAHLNVQIITADVGAVEGVPQQEILGVQTSFSTVTWQIQCPITCEDKASSLPISVAVQFIKIPAQPPVPKTRFQINYTEYDCKRNDVCWPELFYPLTRYYTEEPYAHALAKGLVLVFFILIAVLLSDPWRGIYKALGYP